MARERVLGIISSLTYKLSSCVIDIEFHEADPSGNIDAPLCGASSARNETHLPMPRTFFAILADPLLVHGENCEENGKSKTWKREKGTFPRYTLPPLSRTDLRAQQDFTPGIFV